MIYYRKNFGSGTLASTLAAGDTVATFSSGHTLPSGYDTYTKLCSHFDGANAAVAYSDPIKGAYSFGGAAQLSTTQKKFGVTSLLLNGTTDYVTVPSSSDFEFGSGDFTVEWWAYRTSTATVGAPIARDAINGYSAGWVLGYGQAVSELIYFSGNGTSWDIASGKTFGATTLNTWNHFAVTRSGNNFYAFKNGVQTDTWVSSGAIYANSNPLSIGKYNGSIYFPGYIDEVRISKGFARWTSSFTPPTLAYSGKDYFKLIVWDKLAYPNPASDSNLEIMTGNYTYGNTYIITRGDEGTPAGSHIIGATALLTYTSGVSSDDLFVVGSARVDETNIGNGKILIYDNTSGTAVLRYTTASGAGDMLTAYWDANGDGKIDSNKVSVDVGSVTSTLAIANGGTNATSASAALTNLGAVPITTTVNGHALSGNISLTASDVSALSTSGGTISGSLGTDSLSANSLVVSGSSHLLSGSGSDKIYGNGDATNYYIGHYVVSGSDGLDLHWYGGMRFGVGATLSAMQILGNGNVGIGTASPTVKLDVNGTLKVNGTAVAGGPNYGGYFSMGHGDTTPPGSTNYAGYFDAYGGYATNYGIYVNRGMGYFADKVGIGTASPAHALHVASGSNGTVARFGFSSDTLSGVDINSSSTDGGSINVRDIAGNAKITFSTTGNSYLNGSGNFGIGSSTPITPLHVKGDIIAGLNGSSTDKGVVLDPHSTYGAIYAYDFSGAGVLPLALNPSGGNVGIGKTNPATALDVNGTVTATAFSGDGNGVFPSQAGNSGKFITTNGSAISWGNAGGMAIFTSSGTWTAPTGVSLAVATLVGAGADGASAGFGANAGAGGQGGQTILNYPTAVSGGTGYSVVIGTRGNAGGNTTFNGLTAIGGSQGVSSSNPGNLNANGSSGGVMGIPGGGCGSGSGTASTGGGGSAFGKGGTSGANATGYGGGGGGGYGYYAAGTYGTSGLVIIQW